MMTINASINIRDIEVKLFHYLFTNKVATSLQIRRDIYNEISHQAVYKRLNLLIQEGYLCAICLKNMKRKVIYSITVKTLKEYVGQDDDLRSQMKSNSIFHDVDLVDIRHQLKRSETVKKYYTENLIQSNLYGPDKFSIFTFVRPDAILELELKSGTYSVSLEYERTLKYNKKGRQFFSHYYLCPDIHAVLIICKNSNIMQIIQKREKAILKGLAPKCFYTTLSEVIEKNRFEFANLEGKRLILKPPNEVASLG